MADNKKDTIVSEQELKEVNNEEQQNNETPKEEETKKDDKKKSFDLKKIGKKALRIGEGVLAIFGGIVGGLLVADKVTSKRRKKKYDAWKASQTSAPVQNTTVFQEINQENDLGI